MKSKEEKIKEQIELFEKIKGRKLKDEEIEFVKNQFETPIAKDIELRDGEVDIRELSDKDFRQLVYREFRDMNTRLKFIQEMNNELIIALYTLIKLKGVDPLKVIDEMTTEVWGKMNDGQIDKH